MPDYMLSPINCNSTLLSIIAANHRWTLSVCAGICIKGFASHPGKWIYLKTSRQPFYIYVRKCQKVIAVYKSNWYPALYQLCSVNTSWAVQKKPTGIIRVQTWHDSGCQTNETFNFWNYFTSFFFFLSVSHRIIHRAMTIKIFFIGHMIFSISVSENSKIFKVLDDGFNLLLNINVKLDFYFMPI